MTDKLLNINEVAEYLGLEREKVKELVDNGTIPAYKIAGSFLRFNKKEIDEIREKIFNAAKGKEKAPVAEIKGGAARYSFGERVSDFFYFNDFYIASLLVIAAIIYVIFS